MSLKTNNSFFLVSFFFWQDIDFILMSRERTCMSLVTRVCMLVCVCSGRLDAALTLSCFVSSVLFTSQSPQKKRKKSRQRDEQQLVEAAFEFPTWFSPHLILSFSLFWLPLLFGVYDMCLMITLINK